jgi:hypothetical protein
MKRGNEEMYSGSLLFPCLKSLQICDRISCLEVQIEELLAFDIVQLEVLISTLSGVLLALAAEGLLFVHWEVHMDESGIVAILPGILRVVRLHNKRLAQDSFFGGGRLRVRLHFGLGCDARRFGDSH